MSVPDHHAMPAGDPGWASDRAAAVPPEDRTGGPAPSPARLRGGDEGAAPGSRRMAHVVVVGLVVALAGLAADLVVHAVHPPPQAAEPGLVGPGATPWHLGLFAGVVVAGLGAAAVALRSGTRWGRGTAALLAALVVAAVAGAGWSQLEVSRSAPSSGAPEHGDSGEKARGRPGPAAFLRGEPRGGGAHDEGASRLDASQARTLERQLAAARRRTARYRDIARARADGYVQVTQFIPELGLHLADPGALGHGFDPGRPAILLYEPSPAGRLALVGVAYAVPGGSRAPEGFAGDADRWHVHHDLCFLPGGSVARTGSAERCAAKGGFFQRRTPWLLHAWIWKTNPLGVFVEANPLVQPRPGGRDQPGR